MISQLTEGSRRVYAILSEHINPFNHAMQMPNVRGMIDMATDTGRAMADVMVKTQAQIIAFSHDYQLVMLFILVTIPLTIMIGSTKATLRAQSVGAGSCGDRVASRLPACPLYASSCLRSSQIRSAAAADAGETAV